MSGHRHAIPVHCTLLSALQSGCSVVCQPRHSRLGLSLPHSCTLRLHSEMSELVAARHSHSAWEQAPPLGQYAR